MDLNKCSPELRDKILKQIQDEDCCKIASPVVERTTVNEPLGTNEAQERHSGRLAVVVTSFRRRLLDEDNLAIKWAVDACRYAGILHSDAPDQVSIKAKQQKVKTKEEERTEIEITPE